MIGVLLIGIVIGLVLAGLLATGRPSGAYFNPFPGSLPDVPPRRRKEGA